VENLDNLTEFTSTPWRVVEGKIVDGSESMPTPESSSSQLTSHRDLGIMVKESQTLSYIEGDMLGLIPHVSIMVQLLYRGYP